MKIRELIEVLAELNPEFEVVMSRDGEGNSYSPLSDYGLRQYVPENSWCGEVRTIDYPVDDGGCLEKDINAVVLWPVG